MVMGRHVLDSVWDAWHHQIFTPSKVVLYNMGKVAGLNVLPYSCTSSENMVGMCIVESIKVIIKKSRVAKSGYRLYATEIRQRGKAKSATWKNSKYEWLIGHISRLVADVWKIVNNTKTQDPKCAGIITSSRTNRQNTTSTMQGSQEKEGARSTKWLTLHPCHNVKKPR